MYSFDVIDNKLVFGKQGGDVRSIATLTDSRLNGDFILEVNGKPVKDILEFRFITADSEYAITEAYGTINLSAKVIPADAAQGVIWSVDNKDIGSVDENGVITANYYGEAIVLCSYNVSDDYSFEETVNVNVSQAYEDAKDIRISTTDILNNEPGMMVASLSIPDAPIGVTYTYTVAENEYFELAGNSVILKKRIEAPTAQFTVTAQGKHVLDGVYAEIGTPITKTFTMKPVSNIVSVEEVASSSVYIGTSFANLKLPETLEVTLSNGEVIECNITWSQSAYNPDVAATYVIKGKIEKPDNVTNIDDISAKTSVAVNKRSSR